MNVLLFRGCALLLGFFLEQCAGWPDRLPHPILFIGRLISGAERLLRALFPKTKGGERAAGILMAAVLPLLTFAVSFVPLWFLYRWNRFAGAALEAAFCWSIFASGSLRDAAKAVSRALETGLPEGRKAVSMIVGRDTQALTEAGVLKATVETVAENLSDGVIAPLLFTVLLGAPGGYLYKTVNTMDSMVGYVNDRYRYFGTGAARLDDFCNLLPARLSGLLMIALSAPCGLDRRGARRIFHRDRYRHKSPNSAQTESVMAGALGVQLGGDASYFGELHHKETIGDDTRPIERADVGRACRLMLAVSDTAAAFCGLAAIGLGVFL